MSSHVYEFAVTRRRLIERNDTIEVSSTSAAADLAIAMIGSCDREHLLAIYLDAECRVTGLETIAVGTATHVEAHPREIFRGAVLAGAVQIVLAHNHPTGNSRPSRPDRVFAARMLECGLLLGLPVRESIVVTDHDWQVIQPMSSMEMLFGIDERADV